MTTKTPHVHAELIKAWADGAAIQLLGEASGTWYNCIPSWEPRTQYRIKPEPKPDIVRYARVQYNPKSFSETFWYGYRTQADNIKATFDGDTGKLKSVEIIK